MSKAGRTGQVFVALATVSFYLLASVITAWCAAACFYDIRNGALRNLVCPVVAGVLLSSLLWSWRKRQALIIWSLCVAGVLFWWFSLAPPQNADWQTDVSRVAWAERNGDTITLHNVRNCDYQTELSYTPHWETATVKLSQLDGVDLFVVHWGSPLIAHAIVSFQFNDGQHIALSIEVRKMRGQTYSAIRGFFRQFTLIYVVALEKDVVRVRTNYRVGEDVRLYRTRMTPADSRNLFLAYVGWINKLVQHPEWYNALNANCSRGITNYLAQAKVGGVSALDWRTIFNGKGDEMLYDLGDLVSGNLPFHQLAAQALINPVARSLPPTADYSDGIRVGRVGFRNSER
jgi:hypothetical protein